MSDKKDIYCLLFERGGTINIINEKRGEPVVQAFFVEADCSHETYCPFRNKYHRCPTWEEIQLKYRQGDN